MLIMDKSHDLFKEMRAVDRKLKSNLEGPTKIFLLLICTTTFFHCYVGRKKFGALTG